MFRVVENDGPKYTVVLEHPDEGVSIHSFFIDSDEEPSVFADSEEWTEFNKRIIKAAWETFNKSGYWHTMTITAEYVFDGEAHIATLCENIGWAEL